MEVQKGSTEERIINASFNILEKEGISGATTKKIAEFAGVSEVTVFRKFQSKQKLIETAKNYYSKRLIEKLDQIFDFKEDNSVENHLKRCFDEIINLTDSEINIIKVGMEEVRDIKTEDKVFLKISDTIISKLSQFFKVKIKRNEIKDINTDILALSIFSILFETIILWKVYGRQPHYSLDKYFNDFLDIILNGINEV